MSEHPAEHAAQSGSRLAGGRRREWGQRGSPRARRAGGGATTLEVDVKDATGQARCELLVQSTLHAQRDSANSLDCARPPPGTHTNQLIIVKFD